MSKIILIGGPPRSGKTTLARSISKETGIGWISTDAFDDIAKRYVTAADRDALFPKTALRRGSGGGNDEMYASFSTEKIVGAYLKQAETIHPAIESFVSCAQGEEWDYVIEGYHITPKLIAKLQSESTDIVGAVLVCGAPEKVIERSKSSITKQDWLRDKTERSETFDKVADMIGLFSSELRDEAEKFGVKVIDTSDNFTQKSEEALTYLTQ